MVDLKFDRVSKGYRIREEPRQPPPANPFLRALHKLRTRSQQFWAVKDVSFQVARGEAVGIIGHNGAGKSTILKLLSNITTPTSGEITINGRLSALIEVGSGFHPDLTGRENVYLNGSILGMTRREISEKLERIVEFAGVRQFINTPVKRYSVGMYLRLGFSIAAHLDPDILLLDEVLAVGDAAFQARCIRRIAELKEAGTTIVFISHDLKAVEQLCDRVMLMRQGQIIRSGKASEVIEEYQRMVANIAPTVPAGAAVTSEAKKAEVVSVTFYDSEGRKASSICTGDPFTIEISYVAHEWIEDVVFEVYFYSIFGNLHSAFTTELSDERIDLHPGTGSVEFFCAELGLGPASFNIEVFIKHRGRPSTDNIDWKYAAVFNVGQGKMVPGSFYMPHEWKIKQNDRLNDDMCTTDSIASAP